MRDSNIAPLDELFLLLPEHRRVIQGESRNIGVPNESAGLRKAVVRLTVVLIVYLVVVAVLALARGTIQPVEVIIGLLPAISITVAIFLVRRRYHCLGLLEAQGILLPGRVTFAKGDQAITSNGIKTALRLRYEFQTPQGKHFEREEAQLRDDLNQLPKIGTAVAVIYVSDDCFRVL